MRTSAAKLAAASGDERSGQQEREESFHCCGAGLNVTGTVVVSGAEL
jgi:hypothetical protein